MNKISIQIFGREFNLPIEYEHYSNQEILLIQKEAAENLSNAELEIAKAKKYIEEYCLAHNKNNFLSNDIDNIFKYVMPKYLLVKREMNSRVVAIMCNYKFDMEHGIAIVFKNEMFSKIVSQDIIL